MALECCLALVAVLRWWNERVGAVFKHLGRYALSEALRHCMKVAEHHIDLPPPHQADGVWVHPCHKESLAPPFTEGECADICLGESDFWARCSDNGSDDSRDLVSTDLLPLVSPLET